jgi:hypothetical protein
MRIVLHRGVVGATVIRWLLSKLFPLRPSVWTQKRSAFGEAVPKYRYTQTVPRKQWRQIERWKRSA